MEKRLVEIKAKCRDLNAVREKLVSNGAVYVGVFHQIDTYFLIGEMRLKLREIEGDREAKLVYYIRENIPGPKVSNIIIVNIAEGDKLKKILSDVLGVKVIVDKKREIYRYQGVKIHLDEVKDLGTFIEFEMEVSKGFEDEGRKHLEKLMEELEIDKSDLISGSYSDLLQSKSAS
ncbi:MAG: adenylate cyclase [Thermoprotei archaeon]|nr:MAG: adenylate cyclase [Thermoprotei archaeon]